MNLRWARLAAGAAALLLACGSLLQCRTEAATRARDAALWERTGAAVRHPPSALRAARDPDPLAGRAALARLLLGEASDLRPLASLPHDEALAGARRAQDALSDAQLVAADLLRRRPSAWEAALVLGAARLVAAARTPGGEPYREPERWRAPLVHARDLAPGDPEPRRLLLAGTLASWYGLADADRAAARALLRASFVDPQTLQQLLPAWAAVARDERELTSVLPRDERAYALLQDERARQRDWPGFCAARARWRPLLMERLQRQLAEAEARLAGGDVAGARQGLLAVVVDAPPDRRTVTLLAHALADVPPGPVSPAVAGALDRWLAWGLPLAQLGQPAIPGEALARIAGISPDLPPERAALAALLAGDLERAEVFERRADRLWSEPWAPYAIAKAQALLARGEVEEAAAVLGNVHRLYQTDWAYLHARERLAQARHDAAASGSQVALQAEAWGPAAWLFQGSEATLELVAARPAAALRLQVDAAPSEGGVVELSLDGAVLGCVPVSSGAALRLPVAVGTGPHLLHLRPLSGGRLAPGRVDLLGTPAG